MNAAIARFAHFSFSGAELLESIRQRQPGSFTRFTKLHSRWFVPPLSDAADGPADSCAAFTISALPGDLIFRVLPKMERRQQKEGCEGKDLIEGAVVQPNEPNRAVVLRNPGCGLR